MNEINSSIPSHVDPATIPAANSQGEAEGAVDSLSAIEAGTLSVSYTKSDDDDAPNVRDTNDGNNRSTDDDGLTFPDFSIDLKDVMLTLASLQSDVAEDQIEFTSEQIDALITKQSTMAAKNVEKLAEARKDAKNAQLWSDIAQATGYAGLALTLLAGVATANPVLLVAGCAMAATMALSQSGATQDVIDAVGGGNSVVGTIVLGAAILALSAGSGGAAGLTLATTLGPAILASSENLQSLGMSPEAAMWVSLAVGVSASIVGGLGCARLATPQTTMGTGSADTAADAARTAAKTADNSSDAAGTTAKSADATSDSAAAAQTATANATTATSGAAGVADDAVASTAEVMNEVAEGVQETVSHINKVTRWVGKSRLENLLQSGMQKLSSRASDAASDAAALAETATRLDQVTMIAQAALEVVTGIASGIKAGYTYESNLRSASAELTEAEIDYFGTREEAWNALMSAFAGSHSDILGEIKDGVDAYHSATRGHQQYAG